VSIYTTIRFKKDELEEYTVNNTVHVTQGLLSTEVLLDNQANISIIHPMLLSNVRKAKHKIKVEGVGGMQLIVDMVGGLEGFFKVYASEHTKANVLSFADVEDIYEIMGPNEALYLIQDGNIRGMSMVLVVADLERA